MASNYLGQNRGIFETGKMTVGAGSGSTDFELRIDTGKNSTKEDVIRFLRAVEIYILSNGIGNAESGGGGANIPPL